jgi:hypothetical protein
MRTETVAEERERKQSEWREKERQKQQRQAAWEEIQRKKLEKQVEWEQRRLKRQEQHVKWEEQQREAKNKAHVEREARENSEGTGREVGVSAHRRIVNRGRKELDVKLATECETCDDETSTRVPTPRTPGRDNATYDGDFPRLVAYSKILVADKGSLSILVPRNPHIKHRSVIAKPKIDPSMWPPVRSDELEFILDNPFSIPPQRSVCSPSTLAVGNFSFKILVFPRGTGSARRCLSAFVLAEPGDVEPDNVFEKVSFEITLVNWTDFNQSVVKSDTHSFVASGTAIDRGWHDLMSVDAMTKSDSEWLGPSGSLCVRARCQVSSLGQQWRDAR